jgi:hypothetical protein
MTTFLTFIYPHRQKKAFPSSWEGSPSQFRLNSFVSFSFPFMISPDQVKRPFVCNQYRRRLYIKTPPRVKPNRRRQETEFNKS